MVVASSTSVTGGHVEEWWRHEVVRCRLSAAGQCDGWRCRGTERRVPLRAELTAPWRREPRRPSTTSTTATTGARVPQLTQRRDVILVQHVHGTWQQIYHSQTHPNTELTYLLTASHWPHNTAHCTTAKHTELTYLHTYLLTYLLTASHILFWPVLMGTQSILCTCVKTAGSLHEIHTRKPVCAMLQISHQKHLSETFYSCRGTHC